MPQNQDIDAILRDWPYQPGVISPRIVRTAGRRKVLQMRIELGLLQMEFTGRPDGERPGGKETYLEYISSQVGDVEDVPQLLTDEQCSRSTASSCSIITGGSAAWRCGSSTARWPMPTTRWS